MRNKIHPNFFQEEKADFCSIVLSLKKRHLWLIFNTGFKKQYVQIFIRSKCEMRLFFNERGCLRP